jgi:hypothetical protein
MRDIAYEEAGVTHIPAIEQPQQVITILARDVKVERRGILNLDEISAALTDAFPDASVEVHWMKRDSLSPSEQLDVLARTTVLVSNIGSASFRMIYLPDGAQVCQPVITYTAIYTCASGLIYRYGQLRFCIRVIIIIIVLAL